MRKAFGVSVFFFLVLVISIPAGAQQMIRDGKPHFVATEVSTETMTVVDIDYPGRTATLRYPEGRVKTVKVGDEVRNFNQVRVGDQVTVDLHETVSITLRKGPGGPVDIEKSSTTSARPGHKPEGVEITEGIRSARVEAVDRRERTLTVRGKQGRRVTYQVTKQATWFNKVEVGDLAVMEFTRTVAVKVRAPKKKPQ